MGQAISDYGAEYEVEDLTTKNIKKEKNKNAMFHGRRGHHLQRSWDDSSTNSRSTNLSGELTAQSACTSDASTFFSYLSEQDKASQSVSFYEGSLATDVETRDDCNDEVYTIPNKTNNNSNAGREGLKESQKLPSIRNLNKQKLKKIQRIINDLNSTECLEQISQPTWRELFKHLNHDNISQHNSEIKAGVATDLCRLLRTVIEKDINSEEGISKICFSLERVHNCSTKQLSESFEKNGLELISLLVQILEKCYNGTFDRIPIYIIKYVLKIFSVFASLDLAHAALAESENMLDALVNEIYSNNCLSATLDAIKIFVVLTSETSNCERMVLHPGLLDALMEHSIEGNSKTRKEASSALMNFSLLESSHQLILQNKKYLEALPEMLSSECNDLRNNAAATLKNISLTNASLLMELILMNNGCILSPLVNAAANVSDVKDSLRAIEILKNCVCRETVETMAQDDELLSTISSVISNTKSDEVRSMAEVMFKEFSEKINHHSKVHGKFLHSIVNAWMKNKGRRSGKLISESLLIQANVVENLMPIAQCQGMFEVFASIAASGDASTQENISKVMKKLVSPYSTKKIVVLDNNFLQATISLLQHRSDIPNCEEVRDDAIHVVASLASVESNRRRLACQMGLVEAMVPHTRSIEDMKLRCVAVNCITLLMQSMLDNYIEGDEITKLKETSQQSSRKVTVTKKPILRSKSHLVSSSSHLGRKKDMRPRSP